MSGEREKVRVRGLCVAQMSGAPQIRCAAIVYRARRPERSESESHLARYFFVILTEASDATVGKDLGQLRVSEAGTDFESVLPNKFARYAHPRQPWISSRFLNQRPHLKSKFQILRIDPPR